jgi:ATP-dependent helicase/nuclease subunit A
MVEQRLVTPAEAARVDVDAIVWLMGSDVGTLLKENAGKLRRELPVYAAALAGTETPSTNPADQVMLRGRIDVLVPLDDRCIIIDYKTDDVPPELVAARAESYRPQVDAYAGAAERITGKPVDVKLVFLRPRVVHEI